MKYCTQAFMLHQLTKYRKGDLPRYVASSWVWIAGVKKNEGKTERHAMWQKLQAVVFIHFLLLKHALYMLSLPETVKLHSK
jgi:hypothetical protein